MLRCLDTLEGSITELQREIHHFGSTKHLLWWWITGCAYIPHILQQEKLTSLIPRSKGKKGGLTLCLFGTTGPRTYIVDSLHESLLSIHSCPSATTPLATPTFPIRWRC
jgi:hypothetical protein